MCRASRMGVPVSLPFSIHDFSAMISKIVLLAGCHNLLGTYGREQKRSKDKLVSLFFLTIHRYIFYLIFYDKSFASAVVRGPSYPRRPYF